MLHTEIKDDLKDNDSKNWKNNKFLKKRYKLYKKETKRFTSNFEKYPICLLLAAESPLDKLIIINWWLTSLTQAERMEVWSSKILYQHFQAPTSSARPASLMKDAASAEFAASLPDYQPAVVSIFDDQNLQREHVAKSQNKRILDTAQNCCRNSYTQKARTDGQVFDRNMERREDQLTVELQKLHIATRKETGVLASFESRIVKKKLEPADLYVTDDDGTRKKRKGPRKKNAGMVTRFECISRNKDEGLDWIDDLYQAKQNGQIDVKYTDDMEDPPDDTMDEDGRPISPVSVMTTIRMQSIGFGADDLADFE